MTKKPVEKVADRPIPKDVPVQSPVSGPVASPAPQTLSHMFGEIVWLMTQSSLHKHFSLVDLEWMVMPALLLQQYQVFHQEGRPIGVALWAFLSEEAEAKLSVTPVRLRPDEWKSGDRCWLVDLIGPVATAENRLVDAMLGDLQRTALKGQAFRFHRTDTATRKREVVLAEVKP
jgi:cytolysin-activating lysine-acyltransferase